MKRKQLVLPIIILLTLLFVLSAYGEEKADIYKRSSDLIKQEEWEQVISLLEAHCRHNLTDLKGSILLAQAYLGKCDLLKRQGDKAYRSLVLLPFNIGSGLMSHHNLYVQSEGFYLVAYSLFINHRKEKATKHLKKALELPPFYTPEVRLLLLSGRIKAAQGSEMGARKVFEQIIDMDVENEYKALSCFWLGKLYRRSLDRKKAISSFNAALNYAENESTRMRIQKQLASIQ